MRIWLCDLTHDQQVLASDTIPTNIAYLGSYLQHQSGPHDVHLFKYPGKLISALQTEGLPDLIGFSNFLWNTRLCYAFAELIKRIHKETVVVFGGLDYPTEPPKQKLWFLRHPSVDFYVYKEGEIAFLALVNALTESHGDLHAVKAIDLPGVHFLREDRSLHAPPPAPRLKDLSSFPSPYLSGSLDGFFDGRLMPLLTTNRGCPFSCTFCAEGVLYYNKVNRFSLDRIEEEVDFIGRKIQSLPGEYSRREVYISDSNFGMYKEDIEVARFLQNSKKKYGWPRYVIATTGKNNKERVLEVAQVLEGTISLTASVQSLDPGVLESIRRKNISAEALLQTAMAASQIDANSYSDTILGLPGDSLKANESTLRQVVNARLDSVNTWQLALLADSEISTEESRNRYRLKSRFRVLSRNCGNYDTGPWGILPIAEVEEVCVEGEGLPFSDYLQARQIHLAIRIFYNDRFFWGILKLLDHLKLDPYNWVKEALRHLAAYPDLKALFDEFEQATLQELWEKEEDLVKAVSTADVIEQYVKGDLGANLLGKYRIHAITRHMEELCEVARQSVLSLLSPQHPEVEEATRFLDELIILERECRRDLFVSDLEDTYRKFSYDLLRFLRSSVTGPLSEYRMSSPVEIRFFRLPETNEILRRHQAVFGTSIMGRYKLMTRTAVKSLYRQAELLATAS